MTHRALFFILRGNVVVRKICDGCDVARIRDGANLIRVKNRNRTDGQRNRGYDKNFYSIKFHNIFSFRKIICPSKPLIF
jgi:hypothetical protein